jgi:hypothetical protein
MKTFAYINSPMPDKRNNRGVDEGPRWCRWRSPNPAASIKAVVNDKPV